MGYGLGTIVTDLKGNSAQEEVNSANRETIAMMMIESQEGVRAADEIAGSLKLTCCSLDLMTCRWRWASGAVRQSLFLTALEKVINAGAKTGIAVGLQSKDMTLLTRAREMGARFIIYSSDYSILSPDTRKALPD